jgi:7,8-dihydro-6-hydroxymethylpterin dimethyltransferase
VATLLSAPPREPLNVIQPETTYTGAPILSLSKGLPKRTESLCPECSSVINAVIREDDGRVIMEKTCPEHGFFRDLIFSDARLYLKMEQWTFGDERGVMNPSSARRSAAHRIAAFAPRTSATADSPTWTSPTVAT